MSNAIVNVQNASFGYYCRGNSIVSNVTFGVKPGEFLVLHGPNGCGKTTIIKGMLGLAVTHKGSVAWSIDMSEIGYVPQETTISGGIPYTAFDIVRCGIIKPHRAACELILRALASVEMDTKAVIRFGDLSGGQKRRVLFARALVRDPKILVLDEPTANVDMHTEKVIERLIDEIISKNEAAVIAVAHAVNFAGNARIIQIENGRQHG